MKPTSLSIALALVLALAVVVFGQTPQVAKLDANAAPKAAAPKLVISTTQHDFGEVKKGTLAEYSFTFKNEGAADLVISNVAPGCGCTTSDYTKVVPSGQAGKVTLSVHTENFSGLITKSAEVYTNDAQRPQFTLLMNMNIVAPAAPPAPKLAIGKLQHDFGEIKQGTLAQYSFVFKNEGTADLLINNVAPACGCTATEYTKVVPPGQEGKVTLSLHTDGYNGPISKTAEVFTNDPQRAQFTLMMNLVVSAPAEVARPGKHVGAFLISPIDRWSAEVPIGLGAGGVFSINNEGPQPVKITKLDAGGEVFSVTLNTLEEGKRYAVNFASSTKLPLGAHHQTVKLTTDSKETPELTLELDLQVAVPVKVNPAKIVFENVPVSQADYDVTTLSKFTWVTITRGAGLEIKNLTSDLPFIKAKIESVDGNKNTYLLRIGFSDKPPKGRHQGVLKIETNNKDIPVVEVPLTINAQ